MSDDKTSAANSCHGAMVKCGGRYIGEEDASSLGSIGVVDAATPANELPLTGATGPSAVYKSRRGTMVRAC
jgi:hypothetical protein